MSTEQEIVAEVEAPASVAVEKEGNVITVRGRHGTVKKDFTKLPATVAVQGNKVTIKPYGTRKRDLAVTNTARSIIASMIKGVEKGHTYKLKIIFAHFPISVKVKGNEVHVENFFGERASRVSRIIGEGTKVSVVGEDVVVQGPNLEDVSQTAANIELSTKTKGKDQRVFLDGLYIYSKEEGLQ
ncbi:MAG: 50S ribosomal protein L6 [Thermoproteota archaeon]|jgi:large subunit ribosomal protein L6|nr:50S ribosomal protein L6 [Thermoproteota archaeon]